MSQITWQWQIDRAVRYAVSDTIAAVRYRIRTLENIAPQYYPESHSRTLETWNDYLNQLWSLHYQLLALPDLETVDWIPEEASYSAPLFMAFTTGMKDARNTLIRVIQWVKSFPDTEMPAGISAIREGDQLLLSGPSVSTLIDKNNGMVSIPYLPNIDTYLARQAYIQQLEGIFDQLINLIGPDHPSWGLSAPLSETTPVLKVDRTLIGA